MDLKQEGTETPINTNGTNSLAAKGWNGKWKLEIAKCKMEICVRLNIIPAMRKWVVAGLVLIAIVLGAYLFSQPRKGTVEYHKRRYAEVGVPEWVLKKGIPAVVVDFYKHRYGREFEFHRSALIDAGYLNERVFAVSSCSPDRAVRAVYDSLSKSALEFVSMAWPTPDTNMITIIAPRKSMEEIGEAIRRADVPQCE
jgi:hypothetical protein